MQLRIRTHGFSLTKALAGHVRQRFTVALRHGSRVLAAATVRLRDVNGPQRGGVDKRCGVELQFAHGGPVVIHETGSDMYTAIDRAATRSKRALLARLDRLRSRRRTRSREV